eukprot:jgi/Astpho2/9263/Aster-06839
MRQGFLGPKKAKGKGKAGPGEPPSADARARIARIQPFWKTLSAQSRMDLLSIPVATVREQAAELSYKQQEAQ